jgi:hypothetical protein
MPPRVEVSLTEAGSELLPIAAALARWGMRHEWPPPEESQHACADAVLRQLPALLEEEHDLPDGIVEAIVEANGERVGHWFEVTDGRLRATPSDTAVATTQIEGDEDAWIAALGPAHDRSRLRLAGQGPLAVRILDSLPRARTPSGELASTRGGILREGDVASVRGAIPVVDEVPPASNVRRAKGVPAEDGAGGPSDVPQTSIAEDETGPDPP